MCDCTVLRGPSSQPSWQKHKTVDSKFQVKNPSRAQGGGMYDICYMHMRYMHTVCIMYDKSSTVCSYIEAKQRYDVFIR